MMSFKTKFEVIVLIFAGTLALSHIAFSATNFPTYKSCYEKNISQKTLKKKRKSMTSKREKKKVSLKTKLSLLKLVLKPKHLKKYPSKLHQKKTTKYWEGKHTAGLVGWASLLGAIMMFLVGSVLLGILLSVVVLLALVLVLSEPSKFTKIVIWVFIGMLISLFFSLAFPVLTDLLILLLDFV